MNITNIKLHNTIDIMINDDLIDDFVDIDLTDDVASKLLDYQLIHVYKLVSILKKNNIAIDGSNTGTGKTYSAIATCKQLNLKPFIICPKTIVSNWKSVCKYFNVTPYSVVNYETIRLCKEYKNEKRVDSKHIKYNNNEFTWHLPNNVMLIFDEVHKCKNKKSLNGKMLLAVKKVKHTLLLSATIADKIESFHIYGYLLGLYKSIRQANNWIKGILREDKSAKRKISTIYNKIYPYHGSRMLIGELGDKFPDNQIVSTCYDIEDTKNMDKYYNIIKKNNNKNDKDILKKILKARQKIELHKVSIISELTKEYIDGKFSVVIFVNFKKTMFDLQKILKCDNLLYGDMNLSQRTEVINKFQKNKINLLICIMTVGGQSISLHDIKGGHPRVSIISPSFSSIDLLQALGRIHRAGAKSKALQRIIFCANTCEEMICKKLNEKLIFDKKINDSDMFSL
jgi:superfamily II DNA or RNA helicase